MTREPESVYAERRAKWVEYLRSGRFEQTTGYLNVSEPQQVRQAGMCCLGVACQVAIDAGIIPDWTDDEHAEGGVLGITADFNDGTSDTYIEYQGLPEAVREYFGLLGGEGALKFSEDPDVPGTLISANDELHYTFEQIADLIERGLLKDAA